MEYLVRCFRSHERSQKWLFVSGSLYRATVNGEVITVTNEHQDSEDFNLKDFKRTFKIVKKIA